MRLCAIDLVLRTGSSAKIHREIGGLKSSGEVSDSAIVLILSCSALSRHLISSVVGGGFVRAALGVHGSVGLSMLGR